MRVEADSIDHDIKAGDWHPLERKLP